jgi:hypothetical protein
MCSGRRQPPNSTAKRAKDAKGAGRESLDLLGELGVLGGKKPGFRLRGDERT